jgi:hypothetical protein
MCSVGKGGSDSQAKKSVLAVLMSSLDMEERLEVLEGRLDVEGERSDATGVAAGLESASVGERGPAAAAGAP